MMSEKYSRKILNLMLDKLYERDLFLLSSDLNVTERAITHKMGSYLQDVVGTDYDVDCEYNRMGKKESDGYFVYTDGDYFAKTVCLSGDLIPDSDDEGSRVFPDIIVHKRGTAKNYIIVEVKVQWKKSKSEHDKKKLNAYKKNLGYLFAYYVEITEQRQDVLIEKVQ